IMVVKNIMIDLGLQPTKIELGEVELKDEHIPKSKLISEFQNYGFDLLDTKNARIIERIKNLITDLVQNKNSSLQVTLSEYLTQELHQDYSALSNLFSEVEGITIEKYYIHQK